MSVLIKGMEMPTTCSQCPLYKDDQYEYCGFGVRKIPKSIGFKPIRPDWCPLVEVPPHGDLIDRDKASERFAKLSKTLESKVGGKSGFSYNLASLFLRNTSEFPTVIEAEEGE